MTYKFYLVPFLLVFSNQTVAQYNNSYDEEGEVKHSQISLNGSASMMGLLFRLNGDVKFKSDTLQYDGRSSPAFQLGYDYFFDEKLSLGILASSQNLGMKVNYLVFKNPNDIVRRFNDFDIKLKRRYLGLRFNYHFINDRQNDLYLGARFGAVFWKLDPSLTDSDLDSKLSTNFPGAVLPSLALGYKYKIKEKLGIGVELSLGIPQLFSYGVDFRF